MSRILPNSSLPRTLWLLLVVAIGWTAAQLWGLRFNNHDDIYFHLSGFQFAGDYLAFAREVAIKQARLQAFLNMPFTVWALSFSNTWFYDVILVLPFLLLCGALAFYLGALGNIREGLALTSMSLLLFPLHSYFTFPQGYPIMGPLGLLTGLLAGVLLSQYLTKQKKIWLGLSIGAFALSLVGAEYNVVLHPVLLGLIVWAHQPRNVRTAAFALAPFAVVWIITICSYAGFSIFARAQGADLDGRVSMGFNLGAYLETFQRLTERAFLPLGLVRGITFTSTPDVNKPAVLSVLSYSNLATNYLSRTSLVLTCIGASILWILFLRGGRISRTNSLRYLAAFLALTTIPTAVVSASSHYQTIVTKGYLQGHLVSFYAQLGLNSICILVGQFASWIPSRKIYRRALWILTTTLFAACFTYTFAYNVLNRATMLANQQRWPAVELLAAYLKIERPELATRTVVAPALWNTSGVANIPSWENMYDKNYWRAYSSMVLRQEINFVRKDEPSTKHPIFFWYQTTANGEPVLGLAENATPAEKCQVTFISRNPAQGGDLFGALPAIAPLQSKIDWVCKDICYLTVSVLQSCESILPFPTATSDNFN